MRPSRRSSSPFDTTPARRRVLLPFAAGVLIATVVAVPTAARARVSARPAQSATPAFDLDTVRRQAEELARHDYVPPPTDLPKALSGLTYDQYRDIRFRPPSALWRDEGSRFQVQLFQRGGSLSTPVTVNIVQGGKVTPVHYDASLFDFGKNAIEPAELGDVGFAGFRVHYPLNTPRYADELVSFLGASYFRALGQGAVYGASARGLAVDMAQPGGEEFPRFTTFWIEKPTRFARALTVYALLDSRSLTGAYRFVIHPGRTTTMEVSATLFAREDTAHLGLAPITSMYMCGSGARRCHDDYRSEVHDSDGLVVWLESGEHLFRPLANPARLSLTSFQAPSVRAFGLVQRNRQFVTYQDLEAHYERRPDVLVEPVGDWGDGSLSLLELPTPEEIHDNVTVTWTPAQPLRAGSSLALAYRLSWGVAIPALEQPGRVLTTHVGAGSSQGQRRFVVDFAGGRTGPTGAALEPVVTASRGHLVNLVAQRNDETGGVRVSFELSPDGDEPVELRCFVRQGDATLTETWSESWSPRAPRV